MQTTPAGAYPSAIQPTHIWDYWAVVMKRIILVIVFCLTCVGLAYFITQRQQKLYRATATLLILPPSVLGSTDSMFTPAILNDEVYLSTQLEILKTPETINTAVKDTKLENQPDFQGKSESDIERMAYGRVDCSRRRGLYLVDVSVFGPEPKVLDDLCNALVRTFAEMQKSASKKMREDRRASLQSEISNADSQIHLLTIDKRTALENKNFSETTFESAYQSIQSSRERYIAKDDELYLELIQREPVLAALKQARLEADPVKAAEAIATLAFMITDARLQEINGRLLQLTDARNQLLRDDLLPNNSLVKLADAQIEQAGRDRLHLIEGEAARYVIDTETMRQTHEKYQKTIELKTGDLTAAAEVKGKVDAFSAEIKRYEANRDTATRLLEILTQNGTEEKDAVRITTFATEPTMPYSPNSGTNLTMGLVFGIVGGVAIAFLLDYLDDTIRTKDELAKIAPDVPLLGIVPNIEARKSEVTKKDLFAANQPKSTISEAYRGVRTALTLSARGPQQKTMLLTSAGPREGKTTTAINLATVLAFSGARTLIIDADLRKPRVHASFGLSNNKGLTNLIVGEEDPAEYCRNTSVDRVDVLTSGPIPPNPSELLGRPRMREILRKLRERYDHIIVDTPPIGAVTDAAVIATMVDGVILVVHAGKTRRQIVSRGLEQLRYISAPIIGVILNNLNLGRGRYYPGYYHYYYYYASHYGAESGSSKKSKTAKAAAPVAPVEPPGGGPAAN